MARPTVDLFLSVSAAPPPPPIVVCLRAPEARDVAVLTALRNDARLQRLLMIKPGRHSRAQVTAWIQRRTSDPNGAFFVVAHDASDAACGFVQLTNIERVHGVADIGICLAASMRGRGVATAALRALEERARREFELRKLTLRVLTANRRAVAFYLKSGFREVGVLRRHVLQGSKCCDVLLMEKFLRRGGRA
ncbi:MAG: N-acetyltransferase [Pedosphaera sp.]|nr:N-acetyltransferase [Pedosphaera sp.]MSU43527.1 N-acetyltransferase [Pedosphaera sp.]